MTDDNVVHGREIIQDTAGLTNMYGVKVVTQEGNRFVFLGHTTHVLFCPLSNLLFPLFVFFSFLFFSYKAADARMRYTEYVCTYKSTEARNEKK